MKTLFLLLFALSMTVYGFSQLPQAGMVGKTDIGTPGYATFHNVSGGSQNTGTDAPSTMTTWVLPSTSSTSGNSRIPRNAGAYFQREEFLVLPSEMAASGYPSGYTIDAIGFLIATAGVGTQTGTLNIYLRNTTDVTYTLGSTWTTTGFTMVSTNAAFTVPIAVGAYTIPFVGGSSFTYTGSGVYVAWEFSNPTLVGGTTALVAYCNTNQASLCYGYQSAATQGTALAVTAFRPATTFTNNSLTDIVQVTNIYTTERVPVPVGTPTTVGVRVSNVSASAQTFNVILTVKDVATSTTRYTATLPVTALAGGASITVNFPGWTPTIQEDVNITGATSAIAGETFTANNTLTIPGNVNNNLFSYNFNLAGPGGYGFTYAGTGIFATRYYMQGTGVVKGANVMIYNYATNPGNVVYAVIMNSAGTILSQTPNYTLLAGDMGTNMSFTFPAAQTITNSDFYVGLAQTAGTAQWYPLGIYNEAPTRGNTSYTTAITGGAPVADAGNYKYGIEAVLIAPPTVVTNAATAITGTTATLNGTVNANGTSSTVTYQYGLTAAYGTTVPGVPSPVTGTVVTPTTAAITGLTTNTLYHFRIVAVNAGGTTYGDDMTFTTAALPTVITTAASGVTGTTANINGTINANNYSTTVTFDYGLTVAYGTTLPGIPSPVTGSVVTTVTAALSGLLPGTLYHYRVNGTNIAGTVNGGDLTFTTPALAPTAVTTAATGVTTTTATLNGTITANGASTAVWFDWGLTVAYGTTVAGAPTPVTGNTATNVSASISGLTLNTTYHYRVRGVNSIGTTNGNDMTFLTGCPVAGPAGPITGPIQVCQGGSGYIYTVTISGATGYVWTLPVGGTITAGANTNTITVSYSPTAVSGYVFVYGTAACGNGAPSQLAVAMNPPAAPTITGPASVCVNSTGNVYTTQAGMTNYLWTVSAGGTVTAGGGVTNNTVTVTWNTTGAKTVCVNYNTAAGCPALAPVCYNVTVNPLPVPTISGPSPACSNYPGLVYSTQAGMTGYIWNISAGGQITGGTGTNSVTVTWIATGAQNISVNYSNANGCTAAAPVVYPVTVNNGAAPTITGTTNLCANSGYYNYTTEAGMTGYNWTVSPGGTINFGGGTNVATVSWATPGSQWVKVNYTNSGGCSAPNPVQLNVTVNSLPAAAGSITGTATVCGGATGVAYSIAVIAGATSYVWNLPAGATISSGAGTNAITVNFTGNASSGNITVYANNICGNGASSPSFAVTVNALPANAGTITGLASVCAGATGVVYIVPAIAGATGYSWTVPAGVTVVSGGNTNSITVDFGATAVSGNITVLGTNSCGNGVVSPNFAVTVNPIPVPPVVTNTGYTVHSSAPSGNQWYYSATAGGTGAPISGATAQTYDCTLTGTGYYWSVLTLNGCSSAESNHQYVIITGIDSHSSSAINVYPVPNDGRFNVTITASNETFSISVYNSLGVKIYEETKVEVNGTLQKVIDLRPVPNGVYSVIFENSQNQVVKKIIVNK
jgi:hypothetical protein